MFIEDNVKLTIYGVDNGAKSLLFSHENGMGFEDTMNQEIVPGYSIYIEGLKALENVELSMTNVAGDDMWVWYGTNDLTLPGTPILYGSSSGNDQLHPVAGNGKTWKDFDYIQVTVLQGSVLLSGYSFCPSALEK